MSQAPTNASATSSIPTVVRCSRPAAKAPGSRGTPNHSATYGAEHAVRAMTAIQLAARIDLRVFSGHSVPFAQRAKARPMTAMVLKAQNAAYRWIAEISETSGRPGGSVGKRATRPRKPAQTRSIGLSQRGAATRRATAAKAAAPSPKRLSATGRSQPSGV
ncbi:hypothetical protein O1R50_22475 [Glycomyces luteolus]|uniref:Uncharacterized protein n=1 Tax=Glycomyces luteolus TaxID=2670330 RepID=A0A9X3PC70_9ACTN|nr:hypothetical protein [Glycomyces luteolus]MDA1362407.1 hypothetical protein [Glycomyces luteolus]